jgi:hypothetical protein
VELNDWILALHLLSAFAMVAAVILFWILIVAGWNMDTPGPVLRLGPIARIGVVAVAVGSIGTIVFGLWLAISLEAYQPWDGWVIAALVLWAVPARSSTSHPSVPPSCRLRARRARTPNCSRSTAREPV